MTIQEAAQNVVDKKAAFDADNAKAAEADAEYTAALKFANVTLPAQQAAERAKASSDVQTTEQARTNAFQVSQAAASAWSQAELDLQAAANGLRQGAVENPGNTGPVRTA